MRRRWQRSVWSEVRAGQAEDPPCISAAPAALDRYLAALPAMSLIPFAPFAGLRRGKQMPVVLWLF